MEEMEKMVNIAVKIYLLISIAVCFIGRVLPIKKFVGARLNSNLFVFLALFGAGLLLVDCFTTQCWRKGKHILILYGFVAIMTISSLLNYKYGIGNNVKTIVWTVIEIGLFYTFYSRVSQKELVAFLDKIWHFICCFWFAPTTYSIIQFITLEKYKIYLEGRHLRQGFYDNRLFGIFNDPNYAAITSIYVILACSYLIRKVTNKYYKWFLKLNIVIQGLYIILSGSRTAMVCMIVVLCAFGWLKWHVSNHKKNVGRTLGKKIVGYVAIPALSAMIVYGSFAVVQKVSVLMPVAYYYATTNESPDFIGVSGAEELTQRKDGQSGNISNNRGTIWKAYMDELEGDVFFGGSPRNVLAKWQDKNPSGYLAQTEYETHNGYLSVLVGTGVIGLAVVLMYVFIYAKNLLTHVKQSIEFPDEFIFIMAVLITILVYAFFFTDLFFIHSLTSVLFWLHCGASIPWIYGRDEDES